MKCQNCGKREVNFHYSSNINGVVTERHLCSECARELGYAGKTLFSPEDIFGGFSPFGMPPQMGFVTPVLFAALPQMGILIQNAGPPAPEIPEQNTAVDGGMKKRREVNILREQMRKAAEIEDYEKAMELRERIKQLES